MFCSTLSPSEHKTASIASVLRGSVMSGTGLALLEFTQLTRAGGSPMSAALVALLDLLAALWIGFGIVAFVCLSQLFGRALGHRTALAASLMLGAALSPVYGTLLSGPGVSQTWIGRLGPWLLIGCTVFGVLLYHRTRAWLRRLAAGAWILLFAHFAVAWICGLANQGVLLGQYPLFHALLAIAVLLTLQLGLAEISDGSPRAGRQQGTVLLSLGLGLHVLLFVVPRDGADRALLSRASLAGTYAQILRAIIDLDRDGFSGILGGEDCDDLRASRNPLVVERAGDGVDQNCDGLDSLRASVPSTYHADPRHRQSLRRLALGRPTVVVLVDALRADRLGDARFANLHALASSSINFVHTLSPSASTTTSLLAMLSGELQPDPDTPTLFEHLNQQQQPGGVVGLDAVLAYLDRNLPYPALRGARRLPVAAHAKGKGWGSGVDRLLAREISDQAFAVLDGEDAPPFLLAHYFDLHQWKLIFPDDPPRVAYDRVLAAIDVELGRWLRRTDQINLVLLGDHGEFLGEHGKTLHTRVLARELVHVPLLISIPGAGAERIDEMVGLVDLAPTLADLSGLSGLPVSWAGRSLLAVGPGPLTGSRALLGVERDQLSLAHKGWRLIYDRRSGVTRLFDWSRDSGEQKDLSAAEPQRAQVMKWDLFSALAKEKHDP